MAGTASTAIVFSAAHKSADTAPAANHSSASAPTDGAMPAGATMPALPIAARQAAHSSAEIAPAANHSSAIAPTDGAMPSGAIIAAQPIAASTAALAGPSRSEPSPPSRPNRRPAAP